MLCMFALTILRGIPNSLKYLYSFSFRASNIQVFEKEREKLYLELKIITRPKCVRFSFGIHGIFKYNQSDQKCFVLIITPIYS